MSERKTSDGKSIVIPESTRALKACMKCRLIKPSSQWRDGCENDCETGQTAKFTGFVCLLKPGQGSWVSRFQKSGHIRERK
mmetsp:Transcript_23493/g.32794  ORF Transcript_23493/g.32794 Transcript_23493/m.32794 type:complete len:81 (+) Transcript_23493:178-420(+)